MTTGTEATYSYRYVDAEPNGDHCNDCGDAVFLSARAYEMREQGVSQRRRELGRGKWERLLFLCSSCADIRENTGW